jgi:uncharacterized membrane protein YjgN (DUF898 family)
MKKYFNFQLTGKQILPLWILFYLFFVVPYVFIIFKSKTFSHTGAPQTPSFGIILLFILLLFFVLIWSLYFTKAVIQGVSLDETPVKCDYNLGKYLGVVFPGLFLSIITLGIYSPWFIRNMHRFFIDNSSYKENKFAFQGKGGSLFLILTLSLIVPAILMGFFMVKVFGNDINTHTSLLGILYQMIIYLLLIPYMYFIYKWFIDVQYNGYHIRWDTQVLPSIGKIAAEAVLSIITFGIYLPLAYLRLYKYFSEKTKSDAVDNHRIQFGYDLEPWNDFLFIWGQTLLILLTLGIYYPWAFCKITRRILAKTFIEKAGL